MHGVGMGVVVGAAVGAVMAMMAVVVVVVVLALVPRWCRDGWVETAMGKRRAGGLQVEGYDAGVGRDGMEGWV